MHDSILLFGAVYLLGVSLWAVGLVLYDKRASKRGSWRMRGRCSDLRRRLLAMLIAMRLIRHKTQHAKFMVGIP